MPNMEEFLTYIQKITEDGPIPEDHSAVAGRMILFNLMKSEDGADLMEDVFGLPFIRRDLDLYNHMSLVCNTMAWILEHGMPEDVLERYNNCSKAILDDLNQAVEIIKDECTKRGLTDPEMIADIQRKSGLDIEYIDRIFSGWEPLDNVHVV